MASQMFARLSPPIARQPSLRVTQRCTRRTFSICASSSHPSYHARHEQNVQALEGISKVPSRQYSRSRKIQLETSKNVDEDDEMFEFDGEDLDFDKLLQQDREAEANSEEEQDKLLTRIPNFHEWLGTVAEQYKEPSPRNWLGETVPFPLNQSFRPPVPLSNALRAQLYKDYMADPQANSVRVLAAKHNLSIKRVDAILRLKGMEEAWLKKKPLQTGFTKGMERLLGVSKYSDPVVMEEPDGDTPLQYYHTETKPESSRYDVEEADRQDEIEGKDMARQRYQRLFWESVAEGEEPVMPRVLEAEKQAARDALRSQRNVKVVEREGGRPALKFIDVGRAFVDEKAEGRRDKEAARRARKRQSAALRN